MTVKKSGIIDQVSPTINTRLNKQIPASLCESLRVSASLCKSLRVSASLCELATLLIFFSKVYSNCWWEKRFDHADFLKRVTRSWDLLLWRGGRYHILKEMVTKRSWWKTSRCLFNGKLLSHMPRNCSAMPFKSFSYIGIAVKYPSKPYILIPS